MTLTKHLLLYWTRRGSIQFAPCTIFYPVITTWYVGERFLSNLCEKCSMCRPHAAMKPMHVNRSRLLQFFQLTDSKLWCVNIDSVSLRVTALVNDRQGYFHILSGISLELQPPDNTNACRHKCCSWCLHREVLAPCIALPIEEGWDVLSMAGLFQ